MTEEQKPTAPTEGDHDDEDSGAIRALVKRSMEAGASTVSSPDLLRGVQKKLRQRSRGKFYADGWSTSQSRINYVLVALLMLIVIAVAYFALAPTGISAH